MPILHTPACELLLTEWLAHPVDSFEHRLAEFATVHTDVEVRDELITYLDEDPAGSDPVLYSLLLWPTLNAAVAR